jgi:hypothetical protein
VRDPQAEEAVDYKLPHRPLGEQLP